MTSQEYQAVVDTIRQKYPPLAPHKFDIITGSGQGKSFFYPAHARLNPRPGTHCIETREEGRAIQEPEQIERWLTEEMFKLLGMLDDKGKPYAMSEVTVAR